MKTNDLNRTYIKPSPSSGVWLVSFLFSVIIGISQAGGVFPSLMFLTQALPTSIAWMSSLIVPFCVISLSGWTLLYLFRIKNYLLKRESHYHEQRAIKKWKKWLNQSPEKTYITPIDKQWLRYQIIALDHKEDNPEFTPSNKHNLLKQGFKNILNSLNKIDDLPITSKLPQRGEKNHIFTTVQERLNFKNEYLDRFFAELIQDPRIPNQDDRFANMAYETIQTFHRIYHPASNLSSMIGLGIFSGLVVGPSYAYGAVGILQLFQLQFSPVLFYLYLAGFYAAGVMSSISLLWPTLKKKDKYVHPRLVKPSQYTFLGLTSLLLSSALYGSFTFMAFITVQNIIAGSAFAQSAIGIILACIAGGLSALMTYFAGEAFAPKPSKGSSMIIQLLLLLIITITSLSNALTVLATAIMPGSIILNLPINITMIHAIVVLGSISVFSFTSNFFSDTISKEFTPIGSHELTPKKPPSPPGTDKKSVQSGKPLLQPNESGHVPGAASQLEVSSHRSCIHPTAPLSS